MQNVDLHAPIQTNSLVTWRDIGLYLCGDRGVVTSISGQFAMVRWGDRAYEVKEWLPNLCVRTS